MADVNMRILLSAVGGGAVSQVMGGIAKSITGGGGLGGALLGVGVAAGAAAIGLGVTAVKAAGDFQESMTQLVTGAGESQKNLNLVSNGILNMAVATGTSAKQLSQGMYQIESSGYHGAQGLQVLQVAAQGAKVGNADLGTVANSLTTVLTDYHMNANQAASAMNGLTTTVASGKTHLQDLASSMGSVLPLASSMGVSFPQVAGALATMTNSGMDAQRASMNLASAIRSLGAPNSTAQKSMKAVGLSAQQLKNTLSTQGLTGVIKEVSDAVGKKFPAGSVAGVTAFKNIMGGATGYNVALMLGGKNMQAFQNNVKGISGAMNSGKGQVKGWSDVQKDYNQKMAQAGQAVNVFMIKLGQKLLPIASQVVGFFANNFLPALEKLGTWLGNVANFFEKNQTAMNALKAVLLAAGIVIAGILIPAFVGWAIAMAPVVIEALLLAAPFILLGIIVAAVIFGIIEAIQNWGAIVNWLKGIWSAIVGFFQNLWNGILLGLRIVGQWFSNLWSGITSGVGKFFSGLGSLVQKGMQFIVNWFLLPIHIIVGLFNWLYQHNTYFKKLIDAIKHIISIGLTWLKDQWNRFTGWLGSLWSGLKNIATNAWNAVKNAVTSVVNTIVGWLKTAWQDELKGLSNIWNGLKDLMTKAWQAVSGVLSGAWNNFVVKPLQNLWSSIVNFANGWPKQAVQWGINLIQGFINGIKNMAGQVGNAVSGIAGKVGSFLGFHSPAKEGPGSDADKWAPNLMAMYSKGLQASIPQLQASLNMVMRPIVGSLTGGTLPPSGLTRPIAPSSSNGGHVFNISINTMAGSPSEVRRMANLVQQEMGRQFRATTPGYGAGGVY